ncbi:MAG: HPr family phosphocarrier protein [Clostridia bacterium]|nr:HPr family phosphocarrier protein [Clostridia bacterium]
MESFVYRIRDPLGIHARPAGMLAKLAQEFDGTVLTVHKNGKSAQLDRVLMIMGLGIKQGDEVTVTAEGSREKEAAEKAEQFFRENL